MDIGQNNFEVGDILIHDNGTDTYLITNSRLSGNFKLCSLKDIKTGKVFHNDACGGLHLLKKGKVTNWKETMED